MNKKVTLISVMYGENINGGAEVHCRMLAERLAGKYDVEVLTTDLISSKKYDKVFPEKEEIINGVTVKRFSTIEYDANKYLGFQARTKAGRKIRRLLYRIGILKFASTLFPIWNIGLQLEYERMKSNRFYSPDLIKYLVQNHSHSNAIILFSYPYPHTHFSARIAPEKTILVPTAHDESELFRVTQTHLFCKVKHIAFNTQTEKKLCENIFGKCMANNSIVAVGTNLSRAINFESVKKTHGIPEQYLFYFGRVEHAKLNNAINHFLQYKKKYPGHLKFVITGNVYIEEVNHPDIIYTGFVSEAVKAALIENAKIVLNPSKAESLSLLMIEAMELGKTVLVNGKCEVLKQHCIDSDFAALYYNNEKAFVEKLNYLVENPEILEHNKSKAKAYVEKYYNWKVVMEKLENLIETI